MITSHNYNSRKIFEVGHYAARRDCLYGNGNPQGINKTRFQDWLGAIAHWSRIVKGKHWPITVFIELKSYTHSSEKVLAIENVITQAIPAIQLFKAIKIGKKYFPHNLHDCKPWPSLRKLKGKIIVVLTSFWGWGAGYGLPGTGYSNYEGWETRWHYHINPECESAFVAWTDEDQSRKRRQNPRDTRAQTLQNESRFYICNNNKSLGTKYFNNEPEKLIRSDFSGPNPQNYLMNFPISDAWRNPGYLQLYTWSK